MDQATIDRNVRAWQELMDFGLRFCLDVFPRTYPGCDPIQKMREMWERQGREHAKANERMCAVLGRANGGRPRP